MNFVLTHLRIALIVVLFLAFAGLLVIPGRWIMVGKSGTFRYL
jgi:hypothetical protein